MTRTLSTTVETAAEPSDLAVAIRVAQKMLTAYGTVDSGDIFAYAQAHGGLSEALRIMLRALGAEPLPPAVAELHRLCRDDYASSVDRRAQDHRDDAHLIEDAPRTEPSQLSHAENRSGGEGK